ncbi:hypothetical protein Misp02_15810 [Microtetraspora sp. NBRC 16547]|nr:hypothetical protein Misp02_15810 [Microtetraspora sp. NBRC 16547]
MVPAERTVKATARAASILWAACTTPSWASRKTAPIVTYPAIVLLANVNRQPGTLSDADEPPGEEKT